MNFRLRPIVISFLLWLLYLPLLAQKNNSFAISTPEKEGVSSEDISRFLDAAAKSKTEFHSFMMLRHGKIIAQGWWNPYAPDLKHTLYSCSKSFTATAIGFAVSEKLLKLDDKVISFFPTELPDTVSGNLSELTIKDVITMSDGQDPDPTPVVVGKDSNWVKAFLKTPILYKPGSKFLYNSLGTYMLSAIVQKVTGKKVIDYLQPRLFEPLGITGIDWESDARGINTGGWGLRVKTEDMAKFGQLFLQKGKWNGKQVLPAGWAEEASTVKIIQHPDYSQAKRDSSDWEQGYCYQMWRCRHNGFRADGAFGQFIIVLPDEDAVIAITAETADMQEEINLVWQYLLPAMQKNSLQVSDSATVNLTRKLSALALPLPAKTDFKAPGFVSGKTYLLEPNEKNIKSINFNFKESETDVKLQVDAASYEVDFGSGVWKKEETKRKGPSLTGGAKGSLEGLPPFKIAAAGSWTDAHTLVLTLRYIESPHAEKITCDFNENGEAAITIENSFAFGSKKILVKAKTAP